MTRLNWNDLQYFLALARKGSPYSAATAMGVDHTTMRRRVAALEEALDAKLFDARDQKLELTPAGRALLPAAERLEMTMLQAEMEIAETGDSLNGMVRIGAPDGFGSYFLAPRIVKFQQRHPGVQVELIAVSRQFNLSKRESDIAVAVDRPTKGHQVIRKLLDCHSRLYASPEYLAERSPIRELADLKAHSFVGYVENFSFISNYFPDIPDYQQEAVAAFTSTNMIAQLQATVAGGGLCLLPQYMAVREPTLQAVLPDQTLVVREMWLTVHPDIKDFARVRAVSDFIFEAMRADLHLFL